MDATKASDEANKETQKGLSQAAVGLLNSHIALFCIELDEAKQFYWQCFIRMTIIIVCCVAFVMLSSIGVIAYFWDTHRMIAILGLLSVCLLVMLFAFISLARLKSKAALFTVTKEELIKDKAVFYE